MDNISILLADDHVVVRESIRKLLEEDETLKVVAEAGDGESAVQLACDLQPQVVVIDIDMPKLNGIEAARKIKGTCPNTAILILTAYDYEQYILAMLEAGATGYLLKDVCGRDLVNGIHAVARGEPVMHPMVAIKVMKNLSQRGSQQSSEAEPLTGREKEVLWLAAIGLKNKQIAKRLYVSVRTIEAHLGNIFSKLGVSSRTEAVLAAIENDLIDVEELKGARVKISIN
ncbi:response regulator transcription factor [Desulfofalx alkaliphila]|uniref:response regulator transcription factor n=1 Tax=Desulfofalx alkaliphila TaxID=105483 RepID=UPI0004E175CA|nr:response regulator transcription factor [Desulfofalx alkaliphila]